MIGKNFRRFVRDEGGEDIIEYVLLAAFISVVAVLALKAFGPLIVALYNAVVVALTP